MKKKINKKQIQDKSISFYERYKDRIMSAPECKNSAEYIRKQRDSEGI